MDREKLYLIRNIIMEADKEDFYLPDDVVSLLYQENTSLLQKLIEFDGSSLSLKREKQQLLSFVLQSEFFPVEKEQALDHLMDYVVANPEKLVDNYIRTLVQLSHLHPNEKELSGFIEAQKKANYLFTVIVPLIQALKIELNDKEILNVLRPIHEENEWRSNAIYIFPQYFSNMYPYLDKKLVPRDNFLRYLSWSLKEEDISYVLSSEEMLSLIKMQKVTKEDLDQIMNWLYQEKEIKHKIEILFTSSNFSRLVNQEKISVKEVMDFVQEHIKKKDYNSVFILVDVLSRIDEHYLTKDGTKKGLHLTLAKKIASISKESDSRPLPLLILYDFFNHGYQEEALFQTIKFLNSLREEQRHACRKLLQQLPRNVSLTTIQELLERFAQLDPTAASIFLQIFNLNKDRLYTILVTNKEYYSVIFYLFDHLSNPITDEEIDKLLTAANILTTTPDLACVGEKECQKVFEDVNNSRHIIDLVFKTTEEWQQDNMVLAAEENFHYRNIGVDSYLTFIEYSSIYPPREEKVEKFNRYTKQIEEIDKLLMEKEEKHPKTKLKKIGE